MASGKPSGVWARFLPIEVLAMFWARWRLKRERRTIAAMIAIYCRDHHRGRGLCVACAALDAYAGERLDRCVYGLEKPTCVNCPIHCYKREKREAVREVMRYAGPRMLARHPILAITHLLDGRRPPPERRPSRKARIAS
jgi:hypothetical protein